MLTELLIPTLLLLIFVAILIALYLISLKKQNATPTEEEAEERAYEIIHDASEKAQDLITEAELDSIRMTARERLESKELLTAYEYKLTVLLEELMKKLSERGKQAEKELRKTTKELRTIAKDSIKHTEGNIDKKIAEYFNQANLQLETFNTDIADKTSQTLEREMESIKKELASYKKGRMDALDTKIQEIVTQVLVNVTGKTIDTQQHIELIKEALEKAKNENVFTGEEENEQT